ncbi:hypothetical protein M430DRAFT_229434 [Amorphotheca resinae ATCC 22711]|uniref:Uncharacterized protein n=1 Tax=Amorphotheca resinae ATCC 22711 TaxID=857342 RepID=A0A2T3B397_AMORE|nr:hypothetical protein M430DRAFT_229434 [Amorphotheca resinae ATCC 22711]PSS20103.1 hypothetical protein M430DRAFT_229434 [Amorphotheca resinae ATCC 22711]
MPIGSVSPSRMESRPSDLSSHKLYLSLIIHIFSPISPPLLDSLLYRVSYKIKSLVFLLLCLSTLFSCLLQAR